MNTIYQNIYFAQLMQPLITLVKPTKKKQAPLNYPKIQ